MSKEEKRLKAQNKSKEIGRCICSTSSFPIICECDYFKKFNVCKCAGENCNQELWESINYNK